MEIPEFYNLLYEREAQFEKLEHAVEQINEAQKICIDLFYFQKKSYQFIAEIAGFSIKQVKSNIQNGKEILKKCL